MESMVHNFLRAFLSKDIDKLKEIKLQFIDLLEADLSSEQNQLLQAMVTIVNLSGESLVQNIDFFKRIPMMDYDEVQKLKIVKFLLPHYCEEHPERPGYYPIDQIFEMVMLCSLFENFILTEFFISTFYTEKYNSLYPLIQKLKAAVDESHYICVLLHDEILSLGYMKELLVGGAFGTLGFSIEDHMGCIVETIIKILLKNTQESMQLAVETFRVLIDKGFIEYDITSFVTSFVEMYPNVTLENPLLVKAAFQFIYHCINAANQSKIYDLILMWSAECPKSLEIFQQVNRVFIPFLMKPSPVKLLHRFSLDDLGILPLERIGPVGSLKELCRDVVRCEIAKCVETVTEFMDRIWSLKLPISVKCFLQYIPHPSWMDM